MDAGRFPSYALGEISKGELLRRIILGLACGLVVAVGAATSGAGSLATANETLRGVPRADKTARLDPGLAA